MADLMAKVCYGVRIEPGLPPVTKRAADLKLTNREDEASLGIVVENFLGRDRQCAFFDVWVFTPFAQSHCQHSPEPVLSLL